MLTEHVCEETNKKIFNRFSTTITALRKDWFYLNTSNQIEKTSEVLSEGISVLLTIINQLAGFSKILFGTDLILNLDSKTYFFLFPNSLQVVKFKKTEEANIKRLINPLFFLKKIGGSAAKKITRHVNDISLITLPYEFICLFFPLFQDDTETSKILNERFITRSKDSINELIINDNWYLFRERHLIIDKYNSFIRNNNLAGLPILLIGSWYIQSNAKYYFLKKILLKKMIEVSILK